MSIASAKIEPNKTSKAEDAVIPDTTDFIWTDIKDSTYDARASFFVGLKQLEEKVDDQIYLLTAKRATMGSATNTKERDFAMKEMAYARSYLKSVGAELRKASVETWNQQKETVGWAWVRTQEAYDKVRSRTTN